MHPVVSVLTITLHDMPVVYVTEWNNYRVSVFTCEGKFLTSFGSRGNGPCVLVE